MQLIEQGPATDSEFVGRTRAVVLIAVERLTNDAGLELAQQGLERARGDFGRCAAGGDDRQRQVFGKEIMLWD